ncbi:MAG: DinB family protein [Candidatus Acidiferrales bacterium]
MELRDFFLKQKRAIRNRTRMVLERIEDGDVSFRPEKDALSIGEMLQHMWVAEEGVRRVALDGNFAYYEKRIPQGLRSTLGASGTLAEDLKNIERVHEETLALVSAAPASLFDEERAHVGLGFRRNVGVILMGINEHEIHHRAQLMTYLRMLGRPVTEAIARR